MDLVHNSDYDNISNNVRRFCAERLYELERAMRPWVDGSFGEIQPGHLNGYVATLKELANLYEAHKRPHEEAGMVSAARVEALLAEAEARTQVAVAAAVAETEARMRAQLAVEEKLSIETAKTTVLSTLSRLQERVQR